MQIAGKQYPLDQMHCVLIVPLAVANELRLQECYLVELRAPKKLLEVRVKKPNGGKV